MGNRLKLKLRRSALWFIYRWAVLFSILFGWRKPRDIRDIEPKKILVVNLLNIGDTVIRFPVFKLLQENFETARLSAIFKREVAPLFSGKNFFEKIYTQNKSKGIAKIFEAVKIGRLLKADQYDLTIVLDYSFLSQLLAFFSKAYYRLGYDYRGRNVFLNLTAKAPKYLNQPVEKYEKGQKVWPEYIHWQRLLFLTGLIEEKIPEIPRIKVNRNEKRLGRDILKSENVDFSKSLIGINPFSRHVSYRWPIDRFGKLVKRLSADGWQVIILGGPSDISLAKEVARLSKCNPIIIAGKTSLKDLVSVLSFLKLLVSVDTGTVHLAASVGVPTIVIYGPGDPQIWAPPGENHQILQDKRYCYGCKQPNCYQKKHYCLENISVDQVYKAVQRFGKNQ